MPLQHLYDLVDRKPLPSSICPLFWQRGEPEAVLRDEMARMHGAGIGAVILESRPHPDFLGAGWWRDLDIILDEARRRGMKVWVFDDKYFPSGFAAKRVAAEHPELTKVFLAERHLDAAGPLPGASFLVKHWLEKDETVVRVLAARRTGHKTVIATSLLDLTDRLRDGILYWDLPEGAWRLFILVRTRHGAEGGMYEQINPLDPAAARAYLDTVHEPHYTRYAAEFGRAFAGFFTDEPRFGNIPTYEARLGETPMVLPWCDTLLTELSSAWSGAEFATLLPLLWYDGGDAELQARLRFTYMDVVTRRFGRDYMGQVGDWCRAHGVRNIGHVVEDNGAHARLGYGAGHFFRSMRGLDASGLDIVHQVLPEFTGGWHNSPFSELNAEFFYWGLAKMAASLGHLDPAKHGTTVCEIYGGNGWGEGLRLMKWLTDHACVRGVNWLIPHAFSMQFPDYDHPPHFYARGHNPQWRHFHLLMAYANRVCHLLSGGRHVASVAVLYHAEAEWLGRYEPFETAVKPLAQAQIDCDVVAVDDLLSTAAQVTGNRLVINGESFGALVLPYAERLPEPFLTRLAALADAGLPLLFLQPSNAAMAVGATLTDTVRRRCTAAGRGHLRELPLAGLVEHLRQAIPLDVTVAKRAETLRVYHYVQDTAHLYFLVNEAPHEAVTAHLAFPDAPAGVPPVLYDALADRWLAPDWTADGQLCLRLEPYESRFVVFDPNFPTARARPQHPAALTGAELPLTGTWHAATATAEQYPEFTPEPRLRGPGNWAVPGLLPAFSGTVRYDLEFKLDAPFGAGPAVLDLGEVYELAEVWFDGQPYGVRIAPPYRFELPGPVAAGAHTLRIDVTNTLAKQCAHPVNDRFRAQDPAGLLGPVRLLG
jgi:hypothetical protein